MYTMVVDDCSMSEAATGCVALCAPDQLSRQERALQLGRVEDPSRGMSGAISQRSNETPQVPPIFLMFRTVSIVFTSS